MKFGKSRCGHQNINTVGIMIPTNEKMVSNDNRGRGITKGLTQDGICLSKLVCNKRYSVTTPARAPEPIRPFPLPDSAFMPLQVLRNNSESLLS